MASYLYDAVMQSHSMIAEAEMVEIKTSIRAVLDIHSAVSDGHKKFCKTCVDGFGSARPYPCATVRKLQPLLKYLGE